MLSIRVNFVILACVVLNQYQRLTDGQTSRRWLIQRSAQQATPMRCKSERNNIFVTHSAFRKQVCTYIIAEYSLCLLLNLSVLFCFIRKRALAYVLFKYKRVKHVHVGL